jgi:hypothetical protein
LGPIHKSTIFVILLIAAVACLVYSVTTTSVQWIEPTDLGLVSKLPLVYYAGLGLLACLWYIGFKSASRLSVALALTVGFLYLGPVIIRVPVWISNSYYPYGESLLINSTGHLIDNPAAILVSYHFWPMFLYFSSAFTILTGMPEDILLKFFPLFVVSLYGLFTVLVLRVKVALPYAILGSGLLLGGLFMRQQYFGPQSIAYVFFLSILLLVSFLFFDEIENRRTTMVLLLSLFVFVTLLHPLTSFLILMVFVGLFLTNRFVSNKKTEGLGRLLLAVSVVWLVYNIYLALPFFSTGIHHFSDILLGLRNLDLYSEPERIVGSVAMQMNFVAQWAIVGIIGLFASLSVVMVLRGIRLRRSGLEYSVFNVLLVVQLALFAFAGEYGAIESYQRAFLFALLPLSFLIINLLERKPKLIVVLVIALVFLNIPAQYGSDTFRLATKTQINGAGFVANYTPDNVKLVGKFSIYIRYNDPLKLYKIIDVGLSSPFTTLPNATVLRESLGTSDYIMISSIEHNYYVFYLGYDPMEQVNLAGLDKVYDNGEFRLLKTNDFFNSSIRTSD